MKKLYFLILLIITSFYHHSIVAQNNKNTNLNDVLSLKIIGNGYQDNLYIAFNQNATAGYDGQYDVMKLFGIYAAPQFYSIAFDTLNLSINSLPFPIGNFTVQLGLMVGKDTSYSISATGANSFTNYPIVLLEDTKTMSIVNLVQQPNYTFNALTTDSVKRFKVHFSNSTHILSENKSEIQIFTIKNTVYINSLNDEKILSVKISDLMGRKVKDIKTNYERNFTSHLQINPSVYFIYVKTNKSEYSKKIIIN